MEVWASHLAHNCLLLITMAETVIAKCLMYSYIYGFIAVFGEVVLLHSEMYCYMQLSAVGFV